MRIVLVDGIDIGEENLARLRHVGEVRVFEGMPATPDEFVERAGDAQVVLDCWTAIRRDVLDRLPGLRMVSLAATGTDLVDMTAAAERGVTVCRVPRYATVAVAELALGLMLAVARRVPAVDREVRRTGGIEFDAPVGFELRGRTLGVVGTGSIGCEVIRFGRCLGMEVVGYDVAPDPALSAALGLRYGSLEDVFVQSDVVSLHAPLMPGTEGMIDDGLLRLMKRGAILVNTARAGLVEQDALCAALLEGRLAGAGLDDVDLKRPSGAQLLALDNVVFTPHIGFKTREAVATLMAVATDNVVRFLGGEACNVATAAP